MKGYVTVRMLKAVTVQLMFCSKCDTVQSVFMRMVTKVVFACVLFRVNAPENYQPYKEGVSIKTALSSCQTELLGQARLLRTEIMSIETFSPHTSSVSINPSSP